MTDARYEVTGRGQLSSGSPWDGRGTGTRHRRLWSARLDCSQLRSGFGQAPHPLWEWGIFDHERGAWIEP